MPLFALSAFAFACVSRAPTPMPAPAQDADAGWIVAGTPPGAPAARAARPPPAPAPSPWELAPEIPGLAVATPRGRSQHFAGELEAEVRINAAAAGYRSLGPSNVLPAGAVLLEAHYMPGAAAPTALFAMTKHPSGYDPEGGDWEYLILTPGGDATQRGRLPLCRRCHAEAPHDHLFGGPR